MAEKRTLLGFNPLQASHRNLVKPNHPESPDRIHMVYDVLNKSGLLELCDVHSEVDEEPLFRKHNAAYVKSLEHVKRYTQSELNTFADSFDSVFITSESVQAACQALNCCRTLTTSIVSGMNSNGFALVRPPGHHADADRACGFCLFNNVAEAAEQAFLDGADRSRCSSWEWYAEILYFSVHRFEHGSFWPHLAESNYDHIGRGQGCGFNVNVPLNEIGCTDSDYLAIFWNVLWPLAQEFNPSFVIISAGFDSCYGDPLGEMKLTPDCYSHILYHLKSLAKGKLLMVLEGGYNHQVVATAVERCVRVLVGATPVPLQVEEAPKKSTIQSCLNVICKLRDFWKCFDVYKTTAGEASFVLPIFSDTYNPGNPDFRVNTGDILQNTLQKYDNDLLPKKDIIYNGKPSKPVSLVFIDNESLHFNSRMLNHPECFQRVTKIREKLSSMGLSEQCDILDTSVVESVCLTEKELEETHERPYIQQLQRLANMSVEEVYRTEDSLHSVFLQTTSFQAALHAAKGVCACIERVMRAEGPAKAFAIVRPPGHHASINQANGFCLLNNAAIGVNYARKHFNLRRILILDWDVHHGDGTQEIFDDCSEVLFISLHRHDEGLFYPVGANKDHTYVGIDKGKGCTVNIPWSHDYMGDAEYLTAFSKVVMPIAYEFNPELVLISAGFDAAKGDPLGGYKLTPAAYSMMTYQLSSLAGGKVMAVLEGGECFSSYNLDSVADSVSAVVSTLLHGKPIDMDFSTLNSVSPMAHIALRRVLSVQAKHWKNIENFQLIHHFDDYPGVRNESSSSSEDDID